MQNTVMPPSTPFFFIIGIITCAVAPPLGFIFIVIGFAIQRRYRHKIKHLRQEAYDRAVEKRRREFILAMKSLP